MYTPDKKDENKACVIFSGGGTSGHIHPALAVAKTLRQRRPDLRILFTGTADGLESQLIPRHDFPFIAVPAKPFKKKPLKELWLAVRAYFQGRKECIKILRAEQALCVVGTGGYVCGPLLGAAKRLGIPQVIHEQNAYPGRSNIVMSRGADVVCISYDTTRSFFNKAKRLVLSGNPVGTEFFETNKAGARARLGFFPDETVVLATGGSLGARRINQALIDWAACQLKERPSKEGQVDGVLRGERLRIVLACGSRLYDESRQRAADLGILDHPSLRLEKYLFNMVDFMAAADTVISRAGAISCAELAALGKAAILIPYPYAAADHQTHNARAFVEAGAGICIKDEELNPGSLGAALSAILVSPAELERREEAARSLALPHAAEDICLEIERLIQIEGSYICKPSAGLEE